MKEEKPIRVFISYSHDDKEFVGELVRYLESACLVKVIWDQDILAGFEFHEQIQDYIASSQIFMPLITKRSSEKGWVHQEIGYAKALNIPILPVTTDDLDPAGMLQMIHAIRIDRSSSTFPSFLNAKTFRMVLNKASSQPIFHCARLPEERTRMITHYAETVSGFGEYGIVRQQGGLSSFHIPDECIQMPVWTIRYKPEIKSEFHKRLQRGERLALEKHAQKAGYQLIISPDYVVRGRETDAVVARLETLIQFLEKNPDSTAVVAVQEKETVRESLTIVGDFFLAESVSFAQGDGFTNTFFTRDALEIEKRIEDFDCQLEELLRLKGWTRENSRQKAIERLIQIRDEKSSERNQAF